MTSLIGSSSASWLEVEEGSLSLAACAARAEESSDLSRKRAVRGTAVVITSLACDFINSCILAVECHFLIKIVCTHS